METSHTNSTLYPLRPIDLVPFQEDGETYVVLADREGIAPQPLVIHGGVAPFLRLFDGQRSRVDLQTAFSEAAGEAIGADVVDRFVDQLDEGLLLDSPRFAARRSEIVAAFRDAPVRPMQHGGSAYPAEPAALRSELDARRLEHAGALEPLAGDVVGWLAPHIDYERGAACYARTYRSIESMALPDVFVLLGTAHAGLETPLSACAQAFGTALHTFDYDRALVDAIQQTFGPPTDHDLLVHRNEHSLELTATYLAYVLGDRHVPIVPVLCGMSAGDFARQGREAQAIAQRFARLVVEQAESRGLRLCIVAGVDLAHVGPRFGDPQPVDQTLLDAVEKQDRATLDRAASLDADGMMDAVLSVGDRYRVCGASALYCALSTLDAAGATAGRLIDYGQATAPDGSQCVSFAGMVF